MIKKRRIFEKLKSASGDNKIEMEAFLKKGAEYAGKLEPKELVKVLTKKFVERIESENLSKLSTWFPILNTELEELIPRIPGPSETVYGFLTDIGFALHQKLEKKFLKDLPAVFDAILAHFKNFRQAVEKTPSAEGFYPVEVQWAWSDRPTDRVTYSRVYDARYMLTLGYNEIKDIDFPRSDVVDDRRSSIKRDLLPKFWLQRPKPQFSKKMLYAESIEAFMKATLVSASGSIFDSFGVDIGIKSKAAYFVRSLMKYIEKAVDHELPDDI